ISGLVLTACGSGSSTKEKATQSTAMTSTMDAGDSVVYESESLIITKISDHSYEHISFLETEDFGRVSSNGLLIVDDGEVIVFDTPATNESSAELIEHLISLNYNVKAVIATHFHDDCVGGLEKFHKNGIPSYAHSKTIDLLKSTNNDSNKTPQIGFENTLEISAGDKKVYAEFAGEGHTKDNIIAYFPDDQVCVGGYLIKENGAGKGNLEESNVSAWPETVKKIVKKYPEAKIVVPGHGEIGGPELLDYTIELFQ